MDQSDIKQIEQAITSVVQSAATSAAIEALKSIHHEYPSNACRLMFNDRMVEINVSIVALTNSVDKRMTEVERDHEDLEKRVVAVESDVRKIKETGNEQYEKLKDIEDFQRAQKWAFRSVWGLAAIVLGQFGYKALEWLAKRIFP